MVDVGEDASGRARRSRAQQVVRSHQAEFRSLPSARQHRFSSSAVAEKRRKRKALDADIAALEEQISRKRAKDAADELAKPPLRVACSGFSADDVESMSEMLHGEGYKGNNVERRFQQHLWSPDVPLTATRQAMSIADDGRYEEAERVCPPWVAVVCCHRTKFSEVALLFDDVASPAYILTAASQKPFWACFVKMCPVRASAPSSSDPCVPAALPRVPHLHAWNLVYDKWLYEDAEVFRTPPRHVIAGLVFERRFVAWSEGLKQSFEEYVSALPPAPKASGAKKKRAVEKDDTLASKHPWVRRLVGKQRPPERAPVATPPMLAALPVDEDEAEKVREALEEARLDLLDEQDRPVVET